MTIKRKKHVSTPVVIILGVLLLGGAIFGWYKITKTVSYPKADIVEGDFPKKQQDPQISQNYAPELSLEQSANLTVVVNKKHALPSTYIPELTYIRGVQMRPEAALAIGSLLADAEKAGFNTKIISGYRSYKTQENVYNGYVSRDGQTQADTYSARPGHSEHQTGLAADVGNASGYCDLEICFGQTDFGAWLAENAANYGFIIRYPEGKENVTGYQYEPWHIRFVGVDIAKNIIASGKTLDEYFGVSSGDY